MAEDIQGNVFDDFDPPATTDGSYRGVKSHVDATKNHYKMKLEEKLVQVNQRLKESGVKVKIEVTGNAIQLRATLPLKPNDTSTNGKDTKQYRISLGIPASFDGLKTAEEEAYELGKLIARKMFIWNDKYLGQQATKKQTITFKEFYEQFEDYYFETRKRTLKSEHTFHITKYRLRAYFLCDDVITIKNITEKIKAISTDSNRNHGIVVAKMICHRIGIEYDFKSLVSVKRIKHKDIPTDKEIIDSIKLIDNYSEKATINKNPVMITASRNKLILGLMAVYGLRPREIFNQADLSWFISDENERNTFKVHESNKTGYREVFPFVPEWIELFDLKNKQAIELLQEYCNPDAKAMTITSRVSNLGNFFQKYKIQYTPYALRHACAIRAHLQGIPIKASADNLGHTVEIHTKVYQHHFGFDNRVKAFEQAFKGMNELDDVKDQLTKANKRIAELELELAKRRLEENF